jgi:putative methionine-R-sulfoxide reductase with GAF domain
MELVSGLARRSLRWAQRWARIVTEKQKGPILDEQSFEKLLESAFVLQEHNSKLRQLERSLEAQSEQLREQELADQAAEARSKAALEEKRRADADYTLTLAEIVEAQHQIQTRHLELDKAMAVVAERVARITRASGAGIGILEGATVRYRAGSGSPALPVGTEVPLQTAICQANVRTGQVIRTTDVDTEFLFDPEPCRARGIRSLIAVPIHHDGNIVGALELYFDRVQGYAEQDIHTCQLMSGLVTEAMGRDAGAAFKKSMAAERSTMLAEIEKLQPNRAALSAYSGATSPGNGAAWSAAQTAKFPCWKCENNLLPEEQFCGKCGAAQAGDGDESTMQRKLASALRAHQGPTVPANSPTNGNSAFGGKRIIGARPKDGARNLEDSLEPFLQPESDTRASSSGRYLARHEPQDEMSGAALSEPDSEADSADASSPAKVEGKPGNLVWTSAAKAQDFLESLSETNSSNALLRFWQARRGDFYLALAIVLVLLVTGWGLWSNHLGDAAGNRSTISKRAKRPAPEADLTAFDRLLIGLGLAEAPEPPEYKGNPDTLVWIDLNTAQYYCPGSDLYQKTANGKISSQRDAQLDQFEPAYRKACD